MARGFTAASSHVLYVNAGIITAYPFTMACWAQAVDVTGTYCILFLGDKDSDSIYYEVQFSGAVAGDPIRLVVRNTTAVNLDTATGYSANTWAHVAAVLVSATERYVYINGAKTGSGGLTSVTFSANVDRFAVGSLYRLTPVIYLGGKVAEIGLWNTNLSDAQITSLAAKVRPSAIARANLDLWY